MANTSENTSKKTQSTADDDQSEERQSQEAEQEPKQAPKRAPRQAAKRTPRQATKRAPRQAPEKTPEQEPESEPRAPKKPGPMQVLRAAREQISELTGMPAESVSSFEQTEEGWVLRVEVLELERVPDTMSLIASYEVQLDPDGELTGYRRVGRYERGRADKK